MKIESSLFDNMNNEVKVAKTNIEHEPTQMFRETDAGNAGIQNDKSQGISQFFVSGAPKQPDIESALFLSGAPVIRGKSTGAPKYDAVASSRSNIKQGSNGYMWQQYMPFGTGIWQKQSHIPTETSTTMTSTTSSAYARPNKINSQTMRNNVYGNDDRGMFNTLLGNEGAYRAQEANGGSHVASQRQSVVRVYSNGGHVTENAIARSGVEGNANQGKQQDGAQPTKVPAAPSTELGIPQVIASEPNQKAVSGPLSMPS